MVRLMIRTGGLTCEQISVSSDQVNGEWNIDLLELCQPLKKG